MTIYNGEISDFRTAKHIVQEQLETKHIEESTNSCNLLLNGSGKWRNVTDLRTVKR